MKNLAEPLPGLLLFLPTFFILNSHILLIFRKEKPLKRHFVLSYAKQKKQKNGRKITVSTKWKICLLKLNKRFVCYRNSFFSSYFCGYLKSNHCHSFFICQAWLISYHLWLELCPPKIYSVILELSSSDLSSHLYQA